MATTLIQMKKRLQEAMNEASDAEEIIPLLKEAIAKFELMPADLFDTTSSKGTMHQRNTSQLGRDSGAEAPKYQDAQGNTWAGRGRRPAWLNQALERGKSLADFRATGRHLRSAK